MATSFAPGAQFGRRTCGEQVDGKAAAGVGDHDRNRAAGYDRFRFRRTGRCGPNS